MFIKRCFLCICFIFILLVTACASDVRQMEPPELLTPLSDRIDLAVVTRGTVERVVQYQGIIRVQSEQLHFGNTPFRFGEFHVGAGDQVVEGQVLARLDVEHLEEELEDLVEQISLAQEAHQFENELIRIDISILWARRNELIVGEAEVEHIDALTLDINQRQLELEHAYERQELIMRELEYRIERLNEQLADANLLAPHDGVITWVAPLEFRQFLYPFQTILSMSDGEDIFIEYASIEHLGFRPGTEPLLIAVVGDRVYDLSIRALTEEESSRYLINRMTPPARFNIVNPNHSLEPGVPVVIRHYVDVSEDTLMIPINTVYAMMGESYVYINNNGSKEMREIQVGIRNRAFVEVVDGLEEGDEVFVR